MKIFSLIFTFIALPLIGDSSPAYPPNPYDAVGGKETPAFSRANAQSIYWVNLIDQEQWDATWLEAGGLLKDVITQDQWASAMKAMRSGLGPVTSRKVTSHYTTDQLPHGTRGNFMIIKYETNYNRKPNMVEITTLMTEGKLSSWKVINYQIQKK